MKYPIFILDRDDGSIQMHTNEKELSCYEYPEIKEDLYVGWDVEGLPIKVSWNKKRSEPQLEIEREVFELEQMKETVLRYAKIVLKDNFEKSYYKKDLVILMQDVQRKVEEGYLLNKIRNFSEKFFKFKKELKNEGD